MDHLPEHIREQLEAQKAQCIFCRILGGEIPSKKVYEDGVLTGLLDINPAVKGHTLVMPNEHYPILPLISPSEFDRLFGLIPQFVRALRDATLCDHVSVFIANGGVAGQQSPHFLLHLIPRDRNDGFDRFDFRKRAVDAEQMKLVEGKVREILSLMLVKHIGFSQVSSDEYLRSDEIVIVRSANEQVAGHLELRFTDDRLVSAVSAQESAMLFRAASLASTALFENLGCEGTNIIADTSGPFTIHVLPRRTDDGIELLWSPMGKPPNPDEVAGSLSKELFKVQVRVEKDLFDQPGLEPSGLESIAQEPKESSPPPAPVTEPMPQPQAPPDDSHASIARAPSDLIRARIDAAWQRLKE